MATDFHEIETELRYLTPQEGGRNHGVSDGYRGQFYYAGDDHDGSQYFPDVPTGMLIQLGTTVRCLVRFRQARWDEVHSKSIRVGMPFEIREGRRIVGRGIVTRV